MKLSYTSRKPPSPRLTRLYAHSPPHLQERDGAPLLGAAPVQHQRPGQRLCQILLWPALAGGRQQPQLPAGAAEQQAGAETGGEPGLFYHYYFCFLSFLGCLLRKEQLTRQSCDRALRCLQAISRLCEDKYKDLSKVALRRSVSADNLLGVKNAQAVLSWAWTDGQTELHLKWGKKKICHSSVAEEFARLEKTKQKKNTGCERHHEAPLQCDEASAVQELPLSAFSQAWLIWSIPAACQHFFFFLFIFLPRCGQHVTQKGVLNAKSSLKEAFCSILPLIIICIIIIIFIFFSAPPPPFLLQLLHHHLWWRRGQTAAWCSRCTRTEGSLCFAYCVGSYSCEMYQTLFNSNKLGLTSVDVAPLLSCVQTWPEFMEAEKDKKKKLSNDCLIWLFFANIFLRI